jgi:hypothetical protein
LRAVSSKPPEAIWIAGFGDELDPWDKKVILEIRVCGGADFRIGY